MDGKEGGIVPKPWGGYLLLESSPTHWLKKIFIKDGEETSLQSHRLRSEAWIVLQGKIAAEKGENLLILREGKVDVVPAVSRDRSKREAPDTGVGRFRRFGSRTGGTQRRGRYSLRG
ncbi:MAG: hypothetical protein M1153_00455 [Patescibacteria group bacterium]|nr:hypothetical protein [Patescibacteria group bacterium]